jgi:hypothetical protein
MTGIIKVNELQGRTTAGDITVTSEGGAATQSLQQGLAKAWINIKGTATTGIQQSFNVTSFVDESTAGHFTYSFTNSFNYVDHVGSGSVNLNETTGYNRIVVPYGAPSASQFSLQESRADTTAKEDAESIQYIHFGDLA